jgi:hypothetical protein
MPRYLGYMRLLAEVNVLKNCEAIFYLLGGVAGAGANVFLYTGVYFSATPCYIIASTSSLVRTLLLGAPAEGGTA